MPWLPARPPRAAGLTVDHVVPLAAGGAPFDIDNCAVLCRSRNSTKGASTDRGGAAHRGSALAPTAPRVCVHAAGFRAFQGLSPVG
ncbi:MAG: HNH endonuclease signature motif containing protein [Candidatus Limnocylindrales bacterium]